MVIYKTTNLVNGKIYVGQHYTSDDDGYLGSGKLFLRALFKYGKENFIRETLEFCTSSNVNEREIYWIDKLSATNKEIGYNFHEGGTGGKVWGDVNPFQGMHHSIETKKILRLKNLGKTVSEETKRKISKTETGRILSKETRRKIGESQSGIKNHRFGKHWTKEHNKQISEKMSGENNPMYGKTHNEEVKQKLSNMRKGRVWITDDKNDRIVKREEIKNYIGWKIGRTKWKKDL